MLEEEVDIRCKEILAIFSTRLLPMCNYWWGVAPHPRDIAKQQAQACGEKKRETNHIERFNNTLRQRIFRWGRKTLLLAPKKLSHHIASLVHFIQHYNSNLSLNVSSS